ncbi:MAG: hypothetical protein M3R13_06670 [Armatimonadota bacterium]|nr:hypothetical protein [Armatimonadota bacterium]
MQHGIRSPIPGDSEPDAVDVFVAWLNAGGGITLQLIALIIAAMLIARKVKNLRWHGIALIFASLLIIGIAVSLQGRPASFDHSQLRFVPDCNDGPPDAARGPQ